MAVGSDQEPELVQMRESSCSKSDSRLSKKRRSMGKQKKLNAAAAGEYGYATVSQGQSPDKKIGGDVVRTSLDLNPLTDLDAITLC